MKLKQGSLPPVNLEEHKDKPGNEYFDYSGPDNLFKLVEKDDEDKFPLKVTKKEKVNQDSYIFELEFNKEWI